MNSNRKGKLFTMTGALMWGLAPVFCAITYENGNTPFTLAFYRNALVLPLLYLMGKVKHASMHVNKEEIIAVNKASFFGIVLTTALLFSSYLYIGVGSSTTLHFTYPLVVTLIARFVFHEHISKQQWFAIVLAILGVSCFFDHGGSVIGILMALCSGVMFAIYLVMVEKTCLKEMNPYKLSFHLALSSSLQFLLIDVFTHKIQYNQPTSNILYMLLVACMTSCIGVICLNEGVKRIGSKEASMYCLMEPVSGVFFGALFLQEGLPFTKLLGCAFIICGILLEDRK